MAKQTIYKIVSRIFLLIFCFFAATLNSCTISFDIYLLGNKITVFFWFLGLAITLGLSLLFEYFAIKIQKAAGPSPKKVIKVANNLLALFLVAVALFIFLSIITANFCNRSDRAMDTRIKTAIVHLKPEMISYRGEKGSFDGFNCKDNAEIYALCQDVDSMYVKRAYKFFEIRIYGSLHEVDGAEPIIVTYPSVSSADACIYSPLNERKGTTWFCVDSAGKAGITAVNPATPGYCVDGQSAQCPPITD